MRPFLRHLLTRRLTPGLIFGTLSAGILGFATSMAEADQTDLKLDYLFNDLARAQSPREAAPIEQEIWVRWANVTEAEAKPLMAAGIAAMSGGYNTAALEIFDELVVVAPEFAEGWNRRATLHYLLGNYEMSLEDIDRTLALEPRHFGALSGQGLVYWKLGELGRALDAFEAALRVYPQMVGPRINAREIREILGPDI